MPRAAIGVQLPNGVVRATDLQNGHPIFDNVGPALLNNFNTYDQALALVNGGEYWTLPASASDKVVADANEGMANGEAFDYPDLFAFVMMYETDEIEVRYLFRDGHWHVMSVGWWSDLTSVVEHANYSMEIQDRIDQELQSMHK